MRPASPSSRSFLPWDNVVFRLAFYYGMALVVFLGMEALFPSITEYMDLERLRIVTSTQDLFGADGREGGAARYSAQALFSPALFVPVLVSMAGALTLAVPVAWVYTWIRPYSKSKQGVARALVVLPIAIAFVVFLVKGSLPLAFSLAGIVAAVRFRTNLSDITDAVFLFVVIGIGLSAGVQLLAVSFFASVLFAAAALTVWGMRFAENPCHLEGLRLVQVDPLAQSESPAGKNSPNVAGQDGERPEFVFLVESSDPGSAETLANNVFGRYAKAWRLDQVNEGKNGVRVLKFIVCLKKRYEPAVVADALREVGGAAILKVESDSG